MFLFLLMNSKSPEDFHARFDALDRFSRDILHEF